MSAADPADARIDPGGPLARVRADGRLRLALTVVGAIVGLAVAWGHWIGLVVGAALVALPRRSLVGGVIAGVCFGLLAWVSNAALLAATGTAALDAYLSMGQVLAVSVAVPLLAGVVGGLVRGVA